MQSAYRSMFELASSYTTDRHTTIALLWTWFNTSNYTSISISVVIATKIIAEQLVFVLNLFAHNLPIMADY